MKQDNKYASYDNRVFVCFQISFFIFEKHMPHNLNLSLMFSNLAWRNMGHKFNYHNPTKCIPYSIFIIIFDDIEILVVTIAHLGLCFYILEILC